MLLEPHKNSAIAGGKLLLIVVTFIYSMVGIIYYEWGIFFIVYLFWFENFIRIFFLKFKAKAAASIGAISAPTQQIRTNRGVSVPTVSSIIKGRLFFSFLYFVFIVICLGFVVPFMMKDDEQGINTLMSSMSIIFFKDWEFNIALVICIVKEILEYFKDFKLEPKYSPKYPFPFPKMLDKDDFTLHLTIIFGIGITMFSNHPDLSGVFSSVDPKWMLLYPGIFLVVMKFIFSLYGYLKSEKSDRSVEENEVLEIV